MAVWCHTPNVFPNGRGVSSSRRERDRGRALGVLSVLVCVRGTKRAQQREQAKVVFPHETHAPPPTPRLHPTSPFPNDARSRRSPTPCLFAPYWRRPSLAGRFPPSSPHDAHRDAHSTCMPLIFFVASALLEVDLPEGDGMSVRSRSASSMTMSSSAKMSASLVIMVMV